MGGERDQISRAATLPSPRPVVMPAREKGKLDRESGIFASMFFYDQSDP
jgi:hypothetical protein